MKRAAAISASSAYTIARLKYYDQRLMITPKSRAQHGRQPLHFATAEQLQPLPALASLRQPRLLDIHAIDD